MMIFWETKTTLTSGPHAPFSLPLWNTPPKQIHVQPSLSRALCNNDAGVSELMTNQSYLKVIYLYIVTVNKEKNGKCFPRRKGGN
jgi:hypothetical protein